MDKLNNSSIPQALVAIEVDNLQKGLLAYENRQWKEAVDLLRRSLNQQPERNDIAEKLAFALSQNGEFDEAIKILKQLMAADPETAKWPYMIGYQFYVRGLWTEALKWFDKSLTLYPTYIKALYRKGYAHSQLGQKEGCEKTLQTCIQCWKNLPTDQQQRERSNYSKANYTLGKLYLDRGLDLKARRPLSIAVEIDGNDGDKRYALGKCMLKNGDTESAITELETANKLKPSTHYIQDRLALAYQASGNHQRAEEIYCSIPKHQRKDYMVKNLGILYLNQNRVEEALRELRFAAAKNRRSHKIQYQMGRALEANNQYKEAAIAYKSATDLKQKYYNSEFAEAEEALLKIRNEHPELEETTVSIDNLDSGEHAGVIDFYDKVRGFGFIYSSRHKFFFHITNVVDGYSPKESDEVAFQIQQTEKGPQAIQVRPLN